MIHGIVASVAGSVGLNTSVTPAAWYDATDESTMTLNGGSVAEWRDKSGNTSEAMIQTTAGSQPLRVTDGVHFDNGDAAATDVATTHWMRTTNGSAVLFSSNHVTVYAVIDSVENDATRGTPLGWYGASTNYAGIYVQEGEISTVAREGGGSSYTSDTTRADFTADKRHLIRSELVGGSGYRSIEVDADPATQLSKTESPTVNAKTLMNLGVERTPNITYPASAFGGVIREILVFAESAALSTADDQAVKNYLNAKWGPWGQTP